MKKAILLLVCLFTNSLFSMDPVILTEDKGEYPLGLYLEILEDKKGDLAIDDVQKPEMENLWVKNKSEVPSFGFSDSTYWIRFEIQNSFSEFEEWFLLIPFPLIDYIDFYSVEENRDYSLIETGDRRLFHSREFNNRNFIFNIPVKSKKNRKIYLKTWSHDGLHEPIPIILYEKDYYIEKASSVDTIMGIYIGIIFVMLFYNLFIYISVRDVAYLYYILYLFGYIGWLLIYYGYAYQHLWSELPSFVHQIYTLSGIFFAIMMTLFSRSFLSTRQFTPRIDFFFKLIIFLYYIYCLLSFIVTYSLIWKMILITEVVNLILLIAAGIFCLKQGYRPARYYLLAWTFLLLGAMLLILKVLLVLPSNFLTENSFPISTVLEVILLSLGLADRINDLKRQNEIIQFKALESEKKSNKIKDEFLANLSHEIKTPLSVVYAYSEMMTTGTDYPEKVKRYSKEIHTSAQKLNDYVSDLILITDIESNLQLQKSKVYLNELIKRTVKPYMPLLEEKEIQIELELMENLEHDCDPILLEKAFSVIIKNAIVYNTQGGKISIVASRYTPTLSHIGMHFQGTGHSMTRSIGEIQIKIIDTGIGIAEEFQERIFEKFFRVDSALTYEVSGVGVGLFIAKKIIELHGGKMEVKSDLGNGSEFVIML